MNAAERRREIDFNDFVTIRSFRMMFHNVTASDVLHDTGDHVFCDFEEIIIIGISPIEFTGSEFGVMGLVNTFVAELFSNFVNTVITTHQEHLEIQFRGNTHHHVLFQIIVMGFEGFGGRTTGLQAHHGGFHF